jgi:dTDP-L-rhamnose 4-epimerase
MGKIVLVTGGAGFIGSHLADQLVRAGWSVRVLDSLEPQVHGPARRRPDYLADDIELLVGDVTDPAAVREALRGVDAVVHLAARVGVGQSMYEVARYTATNGYGTAVLLEALTEHEVERLVVASSMSVYGEGRYVDGQGRVHDAVERSRADLEARRWDPVDDEGQPLVPVPTPEDKTPALGSIYALTKYDQERMCLIAGRAYRRPTVALRLFNTYGPRQALSNPYTGVLANFASRLLNGRPPLVFEDGAQQRDLVCVHDVARAFRLALEAPNVDGEVFNVASGRPRTIAEVAASVARVLGVELAPEITERCRVGDIRHCTADLTRAGERLGYQPQIGLEEGVAELGAWLVGQTADDRSEAMRMELDRRGLTL